jgi:hypothetical protein
MNREFMKKILIGMLTLVSISAFAGDGAFMYKGKRLVDNSKGAILFFQDLKTAESSGKQVDICYSGDWTIAQDAFSDTLSFSIHKVSLDGTLKVEVYNVVENKTTYGSIPVCEK